MVALPHTSLAKLLIATFCGLLIGVGVLLFIGGAFAGIASFGSGDSGLFLLGLISLLSGLIITGTYLAPGNRGLVSSGVALASIILLSKVWSLVPDNFWGSLPRYLEKGLSGISLASFYVVSATVLEIGTRDVTTKREFIGLVIGIIVGLFSGFLSNLTFYQIFGPSQPNIRLFIVLVQLPPLVWASIFFFPLLVSKQAEWQGFLMYFLLIIIAFGIPFMMISYP